MVTQLAGLNVNPAINKNKNWILCRMCSWYTYCIAWQNLTFKQERHIFAKCIFFVYLPCKLCQLLGIWEVNSRDASRRQFLSSHIFRIIWRRVFSCDLLLVVYVFLVIWMGTGKFLRVVNKNEIFSLYLSTIWTTTF